MDERVRTRKSGFVERYFILLWFAGQESNFQPALVGQLQARYALRLE